MVGRARLRLTETVLGFTERGRMAAASQGYPGQCPRRVSVHRCSREHTTSTVNDHSEKVGVGTIVLALGGLWPPINLLQSKRWSVPDLFRLANALYDCRRINAVWWNCVTSRRAPVAEVHHPGPTRPAVVRVLLFPGLKTGRTPRKTTRARDDRQHHA